MITAKAAATMGASSKPRAKGNLRLVTITPAVKAPSPKKATLPKLA